MIELTQVADFGLGRAIVRPSSREILCGDETIMIEPKVMQVLVVLADRVGRVVPREEIVDRCWHGRIVGEDAINRVLGKLRKAAEGRGFQIETVARVGYRIVVEPVGPAVPDPRPVTRPYRWRVAALAVVVTIAAATLVLAPWRSAVPARLPARPAASVLPAAVHDMETRGLAAMFENTPEQTNEAVGYLGQATAAAPGNAPVWGSLAMSYVLALDWAAPGERAGLVARAQDAARRGLAIDPKEPRSLGALVSLAPTYRQWNAKAAAIAAARRLAPGDQGPLKYQAAQFLMGVGRTREALVLVQQLVSASPLIPWIRAAEINLLAADGRLAEADRAANAVAAIWPRERLIWWTRFDLAAFHGAPDRAAAMIADVANWPRLRRPGEIEAADRMLKAMATNHKPAIDHIIAEQQAAAAAGQGRAERAMRVAAALGRPQAALAFARQLFLSTAAATPRETMLPYIGLASDDERPTAALFAGPATVLWQQPGFEQVVRATGLADYWRAAGPPDLCRRKRELKACASGQ